MRRFVHRTWNRSFSIEISFQNRSKFLSCFWLDFDPFLDDFWSPFGRTLAHFCRLEEVWDWFGETLGIVWRQILIFRCSLVALGAILVDLAPFCLNLGSRISTNCPPKSNLYALSNNLKPSFDPKFQSQYVDLNTSSWSPPRMRRSPRSDLN